MFQENKLYTKKEYLALKKKEDIFIGIGDVNENDKYYEYYISSKCNKITPQIKKLHEEGKLGIFTIIKDYQSMIQIALESIERVQTQNSKSSYARKIRKKYFRKSNNNQYYKGYWSGILACVRYISDYKFTIDDLRKAKQINWILKKGYEEIKK